MSRGGVATCTVVTIIILFIVVGIPLISVFTGHRTKDPEFSIIDTSVSSFNLTSDDRLFWIFNIVIHAHNPDRKGAQSYSSQEVSVRKGKHHPIADDLFRRIRFRQDPLNSTLLKVEAVAIYKRLERKIAGELRDDVVNGAGLVNVYLSGWVGAKILKVKCRNVVVAFSKSLAKFPKVNCEVDTYYPDDG